MSQYYPQQGPVYPPPQQSPESDYYYDENEYEYEEIEDDSFSSKWLRPLLAFLTGGCVMLLCIGVCGVLFGSLWILDSTMAPTPLPGSDVGLSFDDPAFPNEPVVNDQGVQLTILEVNRNAVIETIPTTEGREVIIVTLELLNLGEQDVAYAERDFKLLNDFEEAYAPTIGAIVGSLDRGALSPNDGLEGRLVFEVIAGETDLRLLWEPGRDSSPRYIYLE